MGDDADDDYDDGFGDEHTQESEDEYGFEEDDPSRKTSQASNTAAAAAAVKRDDNLGARLGSRGSSQDFEPDFEDEDDPSRKTSRASNTAAAAAAAVKRDDNLGGRGSRGSSQDFEPDFEDDEDAPNGPEEDAFEQNQDHREHSFHMDGDGSRASSREFQEPDLPWAEDPPPNVQFGGEEAQHGPSEVGLKQHYFHMDDDGSRASSREFQEPDLPWAEDPPPTIQVGGEEVERDPSGADLNQPDEDEAEFGRPLQEVERDPSGADLNQPDEDEAEFGRPLQEIHNKDPNANWRAAKGKLAADDPADDLQRAESLYRRMLAWREGADQFQAGNYEVDRTLFKKSSTRSVESSTWLSHSGKPGDAHMGMEEDAWRAAMDKLAAAHESAGDVERAESLYLRMLAWREGADQFQAGNYEVGQTLFKKSSTYRSVEDATWFLHNVKPDDGHMGTEAVALLALGEEIAAKAAIAVWTLALRASQREQLTKAGALELTAKAIAFHSNNPELQAAGAGVLRLLCSGHRLAQRNRRRVVFLGGAESILHAIQTFPDDCEVMREACGALRAMAHKNPVGARRIIENDGFKYCMEALEYPDDSVSSLASKAIGALQCAAEVDFRGSDAQAENLQALWEARLREEREAGLRACCEKLRGPLTTGVLEAILATICIFMEDPVRYKFLNILQPVVVCMQMFPGNPRIQVPSCQILLSLTSNASLGNEHEEAIQKFAKCCGIGPLVQAMKDLPCNLHLQRLAMGVLGNFLSGGDMNKTSAARAAAIPTLITAMQRFKKEADLQEEAINCLTKLCDTLGRASVAARLGLIDAVIAAIKSQNYGEIEGKLTELSCIILCMFSDDQKLRQDMVKAGALNVAKQVISKAHSLDIQRWGCELLRSLSQPY